MAHKRLVLFLGAGACVPFGYPTTDGILPRINSALQQAIADRARPAWLRKLEKRDPHVCRDLKRGLKLVLPGLRSKQVTNSPSITEVLSIIDYLISARLSLSPHFRDPELRKMRHQLGMCINGVLRGRKSLNIRDEMLSWILDRYGAGDRIAIITTNYDCVYDIELARTLGDQGQKALEAIDFGTTVLSPSSHEYARPMDARLAVFKLHGSLNWLCCELCGALYVNPYSESRH